MRAGRPRAVAPPETRRGSSIEELDRQRQPIITTLRHLLGDPSWEPWGGQMWPDIFTPVEPCESCGRAVFAADGVHDRDDRMVRVWELGDFPSSVPRLYVLHDTARLHTSEHCRAARGASDA